MNSALNRPFRFEILDALETHGPMSVREICAATNETNDHRVRMILRRLWKKEVILSTKQPVFMRETILKGRNGTVTHTRSVNYYGLNDFELSAEFVTYDEKMMDGRDKQVESKAQRILKFLQEHSDRAFYSTDLVSKLEIRSCDEMANVRRFEQQGRVFVRGYQYHNKRSPFRRGYVMTIIDQVIPRDDAVKQAFERTNTIIVEQTTSNKVLERVRMIRDQLLIANDLLSMDYFQNVLKYTRDQV